MFTINLSRRVVIFIVMNTTLLIPNIVAALLSTLLSRYFVFDLFSLFDHQLNHYTLFINGMAFSVAMSLMLFYFLPILRRTTPIEQLRMIILNAPLVVALCTLSGWLTAFVTSMGVLYYGLLDPSPLYIFGSLIATLSVGTVAVALAYFSQETLNRHYLIPIFFDNRLEGYSARLQPSIRTRFLIYFSTLVLAPMAFAVWIVLWFNTQLNLLHTGALYYLIAYAAFLLLFGGLITLAFSNSFHQPLVAAVQATQRIQQGDYAIQLTVNSTDEMGILSERINQMGETLTADRAEILQLNREIEETQREVVFTMGAIGESRSKETGNHVRRVAEYSKQLARYYGLPEWEAELLKQASPMHDIGKVAIPDAILNKPSRLTADEFEQMKRHAELGYEMLCHSERALLKTAAIVAHEHHEKWDGSGYPQGKAGEAIHIYGRITAVADVFDALGSARIYKEAWPDEAIFELFREQQGHHFDPTLVTLLLEHRGDFLAIRDQFRD